MVPAIRIAPRARSRVQSLLRTVQFSHQQCPCHSSPAPIPPSSSSTTSNTLHSSRSHASGIDPSRQKEYAFEMSSSAIRFGRGCTAEVGMDFANMKAKKVLVVTDKTVQKLDGMKVVLEALDREGIAFDVYSDVMVEPKDTSIKAAIAFAQPLQPDAFLAFGGGSVIDTAKLMNLFCTFPTTPFLTFVNAPLGAGLPIPSPLKPLIAIPTTAGTGSETTGTAIFDLSTHKSKTGIAHRHLKPTLGLCDPLNTASMPPAVHTSSGLDVLCHALESFTAIPYHQRAPRPSNPLLRPAYQGANPISDIFALQALRSVIAYLPRAAADPSDSEAQAQMLLAATLAGVGFGNAGVHLCHAMSYPIAAQNPGGYTHSGYNASQPIVPHGVSVAVTAPSVFRFTGASDPDRHLTAAALFGRDVSGVKREAAGEVLAEALEEFLFVKLRGVPRGLEVMGVERGDLDGLVQGTVPQRRVLDLAPGLSVEEEQGREQLRGLFEGCMRY